MQCARYRACLQEVWGKGGRRLTVGPNSFSWFSKYDFDTNLVKASQVGQITLKLAVE